MWRNRQDKNESNEPILLLEPKNRRSKNSGTSTNPKASFVGGCPIFFPNDDQIPKTEAELSSYKCSICKDPMLLLIQMYAPLDDLERTLYVFACNKASCFQKAFSSNNDQKNDCIQSRFCLGGEGVVKCYRSQYCKKDSEEEKTDTVLEKNTTVHIDEQENDWGEGADDIAYGWGDDEEVGWGDDGDTANEASITAKDKSSEEISMDDIEAMLAAMEAKNENDVGSEEGKTANTHSKSTSRTIGSEVNQSTLQPTVKESENEASSNNDNLSFSMYEIEAYDEPIRKIISQIEEDDDEDMIGVSCSAQDDSKIQRMLSSYLKEEDDENVKAVIGIGNKTRHSSAATVSGSQSNYDEKYERLPPEDRAFLSFTDRIKRAPNQVVRYAYDGIPMWSM